VEEEGRRLLEEDQLHLSIEQKMQGQVLSGNRGGRVGLHLAFSDPFLRKDG
jgi:hypothetical protein